MSSPFRPIAPKYAPITLFICVLPLIAFIQAPLLPRVPENNEHKVILTIRTKYTLHTVLRLRWLLLSWSSSRCNSLDQLDQANQIIDPKPGAALSDDFDRVRPGYVCPACRHRPQAPAFIMEIHPISVPVLTVLEGDVLRSLSKKKMYGSPNSNPSPELGADKENHTSWERYYQVSDCWQRPEQHRHSRRLSLDLRLAVRHRDGGREALGNALGERVIWSGRSRWVHKCFAFVYFTRRALEKLLQ